MITDNTNIEKKFNIDLINQNILMADKIIPEMSISSNLIYIGGKINGINVKIMIDTGATSCVIFKSVVNKCGLNYLIDKSMSVMAQGTHEMKPTLGTIWFLEIDLEIDKNHNHWISVPIGVEVFDDSKTIISNEIVSESNNKIEDIFNINHDFELILGMTFLKLYRANIDFSSMTLTLNKNIKIKFN